MSAPGRNHRAGNRPSPSLSPPSLSPPYRLITPTAEASASPGIDSDDAPSLSLSSLSPVLPLALPLSISLHLSRPPSLHPSLSLSPSISDALSLPLHLPLSERAISRPPSLRLSLSLSLPLRLRRSDEAPVSLALPPSLCLSLSPSPCLSLSPSPSPSLSPARAPRSFRRKLQPSTPHLPSLPPLPARTLRSRTVASLFSSGVASLFSSPPASPPCSAPVGHRRLPVQHRRKLHPSTPHLALQQPFEAAERSSSRPYSLPPCLCISRPAAISIRQPVQWNDRNGDKHVEVLEYQPG